MNKKTKMVILSIAAIGLLSMASYKYAMTSGARDLTSEKTEYEVTAKKITDEFSNNIKASNAKYLEKAITITGNVTATSNNEVIIDNNVICELKNLEANIAKNQNITIKGRVVGFDDLMGEIKLDQCFVIKKAN
jgi:hypothetical protein